MENNGKNSKTTRTVMHLIATNFYGGPEKQIVEHLKKLNSDIYRSLLCSYIEGEHPNEILEKAQAEGLNYAGIPMKGRMNVRSLLKLINILSINQVDLLCTHGYKSTVMGWYAARRRRIPIIAFSRGYTAENWKVYFYEWLDRQILNRVDGIICVSEGQKKKIETLGVRNSKTWVVYNAVEIKDNSELDTALRRTVCERLALPLAAKIVVTAGRLSPEKGHRVLIDAIAYMGDRAEEVYFVFCGEGVCRHDLEKQARKLGITSKCRFPGFRKDIAEIFSVMDLMVLPSFTEGLSNVILEAFTAKKPVVASAVGGNPEVVIDGVNGYLFPAGDSYDLAEKILLIIGDNDLSKKMGLAGFEKVIREFNFEEQNQRLESIYSTILNLNPVLFE